MTDRELLELAAKAAGYNYLPANSVIVVDGIPGNWNPLTDDGDALRLAVNLCLELRQSKVLADTMVHRDFDSACVEEWGDDKYAATRRAIVRAAAEIGRRK